MRGQYVETLVLSTYGHLMPNSEERTRRAVDEAWGCALEQGHSRLTCEKLGFQTLKRN